jgi:hypothetical protein
MKLSAQDRKKLKIPLLSLVLALVCAAAMAYFANQLYQQSQQQYSQVETELNAAKQRYLSSGQEKMLIESYLPKYQRLIEEGFVGEERRIEWVEHLREIHNAHKLFGIDYSIGAQEKYAPSFLPNLGSFVLERSVMKLDLAMLHEGDLINLLNDLKTRETAPAVVRDCEIIRVGNVQANSRDLVPRMQAKCEIDWLTVKEPFGGGKSQ